jgi:hypothetical protein
MSVYTNTASRHARLSQARLILSFQYLDRYSTSRSVRFDCVISIAFNSYLGICATGPTLEPWIPSMHTRRTLSAQHSVHVAVAMLWKVHSLGRQMQVPYELVEIILIHVLD